MEIPEFHGGIRGDSLLDWIVSVEEVITFKDVPADRQVALVATRFRGHAASWWQQMKVTRTRGGKDPIRSWEKLKKKLRATFLLHNYDRTMYNKLQNLKQGSRSVDEYAEEFYLLLTRNDIYDSEIQIVSRFIGALRAQLQNSMLQFDPTTMAEAHRRAASFEQQQRSSTWSSSTSRARVTDQPSSQTGLGARDGTDSTPAASRPSPREDEQGLRRSTRPNALRCFACGEPGHRQTACPNQSRRELVIDDTVEHVASEIEPYEDEHTEILEEVHQTHGDEGTLLMAYNVCLTPQQREGHWLCTNIFRSVRVVYYPSVVGFQMYLSSMSDALGLISIIYFQISGKRVCTFTISQAGLLSKNKSATRQFVVCLVGGHVVISSALRLVQGSLHTLDTLQTNI